VTLVGTLHPLLWQQLVLRPNVNYVLQEHMEIGLEDRHVSHVQWVLIKEIVENFLVSLVPSTITIQLLVNVPVCRVFLLRFRRLLALKAVFTLILQPLHLMLLPATLACTLLTVNVYNALLAK
jgi:hypothetical protein